MVPTAARAVEGSCRARRRRRRPHGSRCRGATGDAAYRGSKNLIMASFHGRPCTRFMAAFNAIENYFNKRLNDDTSRFRELAEMYIRMLGTPRGLKRYAYSVTSWSRTI